MRTREELVEQLKKKHGVPAKYLEKLGEILNINLTLDDAVGWNIGIETKRLSLNVYYEVTASVITDYLKVRFPGLEPYYEKFANDTYAVRISFDNLESLNIVKIKEPNDLSLPLSDRRVIVVVADNDSARLPGIAHYTMSKAKELFKFPTNHPIANTAYAMAEVYPDVYNPVAEFHEYFKQTKHAAFIELCASLGAKEIFIENAEINNKSLDIRADVKAPLVSLGLNFSLQQNRETGEISAFEFPEENKGIKEYDSPWLHTEPSWRSMNNLRRKNHLSKVGAEFTCVDDMGINASLTSRFGPVRVNIGGDFHEMTKIRLSYKVIFW